MIPEFPYAPLFGNLEDKILELAREHAVLKPEHFTGIERINPQTAYRWLQATQELRRLSTEGSLPTVDPRILSHFFRGLEYYLPNIIRASVKLRLYEEAKQTGRIDYDTNHVVIISPCSPEHEDKRLRTIRDGNIALELDVNFLAHVYKAQLQSGKSPEDSFVEVFRALCRDNLPVFTYSGKKYSLKTLIDEKVLLVPLEQPTEGTVDSIASILERNQDELTDWLQEVELPSYFAPTTEEVLLYCSDLRRENLRTRLQLTPNDPEVQRQIALHEYFWAAYFIKLPFTPANIDELKHTALAEYDQSEKWKPLLGYAPSGQEQQELHTEFEERGIISSTEVTSDDENQEAYAYIRAIKKQKNWVIQQLKTLPWM